MEHLCCHDHGLVLHDTLAYDLALDAGNLLYGYLYAEVATGDHDAVRGVYDLVNVVDALLVLNL